jgi:hypothetical protein
MKDPKASHVMCDGKGNMEVYYGQVGFTEEQGECLVECYTAHEQSHMKDIAAQNPNICKDKPEGVVVGTRDEEEDRKSQIAAFEAQKECLKAKKARDTCGKCTQYIDDAIRDIDMHM